MNEQPIREDILAILRIVSSKDNLTQRELSNKLGISLGKTNYLLKSLIKIGLLEMKNLAVRNYRFKKICYLLTGKGFEEKVRLTRHFLMEKEFEYNLIKKEWERLNNGVPIALAQEGRVDASDAQEKLTKE